jgi:hypothetical protein
MIWKRSSKKETKMVKVTYIYERTESQGKVEIVDTPDVGEIMTIEQIVEDFFNFLVACKYDRYDIIRAMEETIEDYKDGLI